MERDDRLAQERAARQAAEVVQGEAEAARAEAEAARAHLQAMQYVTDAALTHLGLDALPAAALVGAGTRAFRGARRPGSRCDHTPLALR